jgi:hypothetical protein
MNKHDVLNKLMAKYVAWRDLINAIPESKMEQPGAIGAWSIKDLIAHITAYTAYAADRILEWLNDEDYEPSATGRELAQFIGRYGYPDFGSALLDDDEANNIVHLFTRSDTLAETREKAQATAMRLISMVRAVPASWWTEEWTGRVSANAWEHWQDHAAGVRAWLASQPD